MLPQSGDGPASLGPSPGLTGWNLRCFRAGLVLRRETLRNAVFETLENSGTPGDSEGDGFVSDVVAVADLFTGLMRAD